MRDLSLRFVDEAAWTDLAVERDPGLLEIDVIGDVTRASDPNAMQGFLVNVRCLDDRDLTALEPFQVFPAKPERTWLAGGLPPK